MQQATIVLSSLACGIVVGIAATLSTVTRPRCPEEAQAPPPPAADSVPGAAAPSVSSLPARTPLPAEPSLWEPIDLRALGGRWVGAARGDAIRGSDGGRFGRNLMPGGYRADFVEDRKGSKTPWNVQIWAPREGHMEADTVSMGCGFYRTLHQADAKDASVAFRKAFCRGYGLEPGDAHPTTIVLEKSTRNERIRVRVGHYIDAELVRE